MKIFTLDDKDMCGSIIIDKIDKIVEIKELRSNKSCVASNEHAIGRIIIVFEEISKLMDINKIILSDRSYHKDFIFRLDLGNTLTDGYPYYYKYGYIYEDESNHRNVIKNNETLSKIKTTDIDNNEIFKIVIEKVKLNKKLMSQIKKIYNEEKDKNIKTFLKRVKYDMCELFSLIYTDLYKLLKLNYYDKTLMGKQL